MGGKWTAYYDGQRMAAGAFRVEGDTYIMLSLSGFQSCPVPMMYKYSFDGTYLKFQLTEQSKNDSCDARAQRYNNTTYILSE
jgi:hypothetical protein